VWRRRDREAGLRWLARPAELGEMDAQYELGSAYYRGAASPASERGR
jgi:TPR repeat protein